MARANARADLPVDAAGPLRVVDLVSSIDDLAPLDGYQREMVSVVGRLLSDGVDVLQVTQTVARLNDILTTRLLGLAATELGQPPCAYAWLALGSQGRGEQVLSSDQDSAIAFDERAQGADAQYFPRLAGLVVPALARAGLPLCDGGYMATTWCHPISEFRGFFRSWVGQPEPDALLRAEVFLDVRPVHGDLSVEVLDRILVGGGSSGQFLVQMARAAVRFTPPLGVFGQLRTKDSTIDVKRAGIAAIVLLARLYGLAAGSTARTTVARLDAAGAGGTLSRGGAGKLIEAYRLLTGLRLRHQVDQVGAGLAPDNLIRLEDLTGEDRRRMRDGLRIVRDVQQVTAMRFATHMVT
ncbi:MAG: putative nucleotidyltransferase substrate binding domain-containing protein [Dermatophilaceae bacterium]